MRFSSVATIVATVGAVAAEDIYLGFNSGATYDDRTVKKQDDFEKEFNAQQKLAGSPGVFNSVRLYTNIKPETKDDPIEAFAAAVSTKTKLLLGMWTSGTTNITNELSALDKAIDTLGKDFTDLVVGISVGSEDLYRNSDDGVKNDAGVGQPVETIIDFIKDTRDALKDTALAKIPVGHVDTWTAWVNVSNKDVIEASDFLGTDIYPYYENGDNVKMTNEIDNAVPIFQFALNATEKVAGDKPVWITETGWPSTGPKWNQAQPSEDNAKKYWDDIGCSLFGNTSTWWYIMRDSNPDNKMKFGIDPELDGTARFNLTCPASAGAPAPVNNNGESDNNSNSDSNKPSLGVALAVSKTNALALSLSLVFAFAAWVV